MAEATADNPQNPSSQGADPQGDKPEFLLEKFHSVEDQAKGYQALEKKYHEDLAALKGKMDQLERAGVRVEDTRPHADPKEEDDKELVEFYRSPSSYRRRVIEEAKHELRTESAVVNSLRDVLARFFKQNPDLLGSEDILEGYVRQEDPQLAPWDKLERAAKRTRERIVSYRKTPEPNPSPQDFVDEPSGAQPRARSQSPKASEADLRKEFFSEHGSPRKLPAKRLPQGE